MAERGDVWAVGSQDYDSFLFGSPRTVRNITITGRQSYPSKGTSKKLNPQVAELDDVLEESGLDRRQLVDVGILVGTDYNDGVKGVGPVTALRYVTEHGRIEDIHEVQGKIDLEEVEIIREIFLDADVTDEYEIEPSELDVDGVVDFLCGERDFSEDRVRKALGRISGEETRGGLDQWVT
jgi:flap endonuclease-1